MAGRLPVFGDDLSQQRHQIELAQLWLPVALKMGEVEQFVDLRGHARGKRVDARQEHGKLPLIGGAGMGEQAVRKLSVALDGAERVFQIVRHEREEFVARAQRLLNLLEEVGNFQAGGHPRQQFAGREGLHKVVIGPGLQAFDGRLLTGAGREQDDGQHARRWPISDSLKQLEAVQPRHHHIADDQIGRLLLDLAQRRQPVPNGFDRVVRAEDARDIFQHICVIIDHEQARPGPLVIGCCRREDLPLFCPEWRNYRLPCARWQPAQGFLHIRYHPGRG